MWRPRAEMMPAASRRVPRTLARLLSGGPAREVHRVRKKNLLPPDIVPAADDDGGLHFARQLSRYDISDAEQRRWSAQASSFPREWEKRARHQPRQRFEADGLQQIHKLSFGASVLLEIRSAMVPASSHHPSFTRLARHRAHLICYTHADLLDAPTVQRIAEWTGASWPNAQCMFVDSREMRKATEPFAALRSWVLAAVAARGGNNCALTVGVPNVGKSSVLLSLMRELPPSQQCRRVRLEKGKALKRGKPGILNKPGHTRELTQFMLRDKPRAWCLDVPGITPPPDFFFERPEAWCAPPRARCARRDRLFDRL